MTSPPSSIDNVYNKMEGARLCPGLEVPMRKRLVIGCVCLLSAVVFFLLGCTEITFSIREDYLSNVTLFPAAGLALLGIAQFIKVMRLKLNW